MPGKLRDNGPPFKADMTGVIPLKRLIDNELILSAIRIPEEVTGATTDSRPRATGVLGGVGCREAFDELGEGLAILLRGVGVTIFFRLSEAAVPRDGVGDREGVEETWRSISVRTVDS